VTSPGDEPAEDTGDLPTDHAVPSLLVVHPDLVVRTSLQRRLGDRVQIRFAGTLAALARGGEGPAPNLVVLDSAVPGAWAAPTVKAFRDRGCRVVLVGPPADAQRVREAIRLGADDYAGTFDELVARLGRWLPPC
jgi:CheY-like chemotaxis protein